MFSGGTSATAVSKFQKMTPDNLAYEVFSVSFSGTDTDCTVTPTNIKSILWAAASPADATSAADGYYLTSFVPGAPTVTFTGPSSSDGLIIVFGMIA